MNSAAHPHRTADWFVISERADPGAIVGCTASWATATGTGRVTPVDRPVSA